MNRCIRCDAPLFRDDIGANRKFLGRALREFMCRECLSRELRVPRQLIDQKIQQFKEEGCTLFM